MVGNARQIKSLTWKCLDLLAETMLTLIIQVLLLYTEHYTMCGNQWHSDIRSTINIVRLVHKLHSASDSKLQKIKSSILCRNVPYSFSSQTYTHDNINSPRE